MKVTLVRTGGFTGLRLTVAVDTAALPAREADELDRLVRAADPFALPERLDAPPRAPDRYRYRLTVEDGVRTRTVAAAEGALPSRLASLVEWLLLRA